MKKLISLLSIFTALSGLSQVYTTPEVVTNIARGEAYTILGSITNGGGSGGITNIIIVTNVLPSNLITQFYSGAYLTGTFSGVFRGNGSALTNVLPTTSHLTNWALLNTNVLATSGNAKFNNSQFTTNGNLVSFRANAPVTNLFNFGTLNLSSYTVPSTGPYFLWDSDASYPLEINFRHPSYASLGQIVKADNGNFLFDFTSFTTPNPSYVNINKYGIQSYGRVTISAYQVATQLGLTTDVPALGELASIEYVSDRTLSHKSYPTNLVLTGSSLTNGLLSNRSGTNFWTLDGSSLTNIQVSITNLANIVTQGMTGTKLSGTFSSGGTYPLWITNFSNEGYVLGLGSDSTTNIALRWDATNKRLIAPSMSASGVFVGNGASLTNVVGLMTNAPLNTSPALRPAFTRPTVTPYVRNPYTNAVMGWFSWNNNQCPDQWYWTNMIGAMVNLGFRDAGYTAVCFDAPWQEGVDAYGYPLWNTNRFPDGIAYCSKYARDRGFKFFMWTPFSQFTNNIKYAGCTTNWQGAGGYAAQTAHFMATNFVEGVVGDNFYSAGFDTRLQEFIAAMEVHVATNGRPVWYKTIGYGSWFPPFATNIHSMRVATDITPAWTNIAKQFNAWEAAAYSVGPNGCIPSMDMMVAGCTGGTGETLTDDEMLSHVSIWAISGTEFFLGMNLTNISSTVRQTVTNADILKLVKDSGVYPGRIVKRTRVASGTQDVWLKPAGWLGSGTNYVLIVNNSTNEGYAPIRFSEFGLGSNNWVRCITPFYNQDHGIVPDYFRYKYFYPHQSRLYLVVSDPITNNVVGTYTDYLINGDANVNLSGTFVGDGSGVTNVSAKTLVTGAAATNLNLYGLINLGGSSFAYYDTNSLMTVLASTYSASLFGNNAWLTNIYPKRIHGSPDGGGGYQFDVDSSGNVIGRTFTGDGSGLTNVTASATIPSYVVTNNQQNVTLGGTFTGNGSGLTNLNLNSTSLTNITLRGDTTIYNGSVQILSTLTDSPGIVTTGGTLAAALVTATNFVGPLNGNGSGATNLNASNLISGTVAESRLPVVRTADMVLTNTLTIYPSATAANQLRVFTTNSTPTLTVTSNRVGIGTATPSATLQVAGNILGTFIGGSSAVYGSGSSLATAGYASASLSAFGGAYITRDLIASNVTASAGFYVPILSSAPAVSNNYVILWASNSVRPFLWITGTNGTFTPQ